MNRKKVVLRAGLNQLATVVEDIVLLTLAVIIVRSMFPVCNEVWCLIAALSLIAFGWFTVRRRSARWFAHRKNRNREPVLEQSLYVRITTHRMYRIIRYATSCSLVITLIAAQYMLLLPTVFFVTIHILFCFAITVVWCLTVR